MIYILQITYCNNEKIGFNALYNHITNNYNNIININYINSVIEEAKSFGYLTEEKTENDRMFSITIKGIEYLEGLKIKKTFPGFLMLWGSLTISFIALIVSVLVLILK